MNYLKDIPNLDSHSDFLFLKNSKLWEMPLRFISEEVLEEFYSQAKQELTEKRAGSLVSHIVAGTAMAEFLGLVEPTRIKNYSIN